MDPKRVDRALGLLQQGGDYFAGKDYSATIDGCTCPDTFYRRVMCKHSIALMILARILHERNRHDVTALVSQSTVLSRVFA